MGNVHKYSEHYRTSYGGYSSALGAESSDKITSAAFVSAKNYDVLIFQALYSGIASGQVLTLKGYQATATNGGGSKTVSGASTSVTSGATSETGVLTIQFRAAEMDMGSSFIYGGAIVSTDDGDGTEQVALIQVQGRARYPQATLGA